MFVVLGISRSFGILETELNSRTMKSIIFALALVAIAATAPVSEPVAKPVPESVAVPSPVKEPIAILRSKFDQEPEGGYAFGYETENGSSRDENGEVREVLDEENKPHSVVVVKGSYSYTDPLGQFISVVYSADEKGFYAEGDSIPKPVEAVSRR